MSLKKINILTCILLISTMSFSQALISPKKLHRFSRLKENNTSICIDYKSKHAFRSFFFQHYLLAYNIRERQYYKISLKPQFAGSKIRHNCVILPQGTYTFSSIHYKRIGLFKIEELSCETYIEREKNASLEDRSGRLSIAQLTDYIVVLEESKLFYLGTAACDEDKFKFTANKNEQIIKVLEQKYSSAKKHGVTQKNPF